MERTFEIETWGTGLRKIYNVCKKENLKVEFEDRKLAFFVVFYRKDLDKLVENTEKNLSNKVESKMTLNQKKILELISLNPNIILSELSRTSWNFSDVCIK